MISPEETNVNTKAIIQIEIQDYLKLQTQFTITKNKMVRIRKEIAYKLEEIKRLQALPKR